MNKNSEKVQSQQIICPVAKKCGGCSFIGMDYAATLEEKQNIVNKLMKRYGTVEKIIGMKELGIIEIRFMPHLEG